MSDDDSRFELSRRALLGSVATVGVATAGAGAGTFAMFQDTESSTGNSVQAGTMDLGVTDGGSMEWTINDVAPGGQDANDDQDIHLYNSGTTQADHLEIGFSNDPVEDNGGSHNVTAFGPASDTFDGASGMSKHITVTQFRYEDTGGDTILTFVDGDGTPYDDPTNGDGTHPPFKDTNKNGVIDLQDLADPDNQDALDNITPVPPTGGSDSVSDSQTTLSIAVEVSSTLGNDFQGDILNTTVTFALHQDSSQDL